MVGRFLLAAALTFAAGTAHAQTREQWIELGARVHGGFGVLIPIGIRIGLDAQARIKAPLRGLTVTYYTGPKAPCPCIVDGVMIATRASPGQGTLQVMPEKAAEGLYAVVIVRNRKTGEGYRYTISQEWGAKILHWNRSLDPAGRYDAAMAAENLFKVEPVGKSD